MTAKAWKTKITKQVREVGTYRKAFEAVIEALAEILAQRDRVYEQYRDEGQQPMVVKVLDRGGKNTAENPLLRTWRELNALALTYWKELGLTAASLKRINDLAAGEKKEPSPLEKALMKYG